MKFLIVGLGNIGEEYEYTRHNIGFNIVNQLAQNLQSSFILDRLAFVSECKYKGKTLILIKPTTYMNLSGKSVNYWMQYHKISKDNLLVITDDIALPFGAIRIKPKGSDGGHNGLKSIQETLNSNEYARLRFGVGNDFSKGRQADYVLGNWKSDEYKLLAPRIELAVEAVKSYSTIGLAATMNFYNNK